MGLLRVCLLLRPRLWRSRWSAYHRVAEEEGRTVDVAKPTGQS